MAAPALKVKKVSRGHRVLGGRGAFRVRLDPLARVVNEVPRGHRAYQLRGLQARPGLGASQGHRDPKETAEIAGFAVSAAMSGLAARGGLLVKMDLVALPVNRGRLDLAALGVTKDLLDRVASEERQARP